MAAVPETRYARDGDYHLAYQVCGDNGPDLLFVPTATFPIDLLWDDPDVDEVDAYVRGVMQSALDRLASRRRFPVLG